MNAVEPIDHPDVAATLAVAFTQDPILSFLYEDPSARPAMLTMFFAARLAGGIGIDEVLMVDGCASAAVWVPPQGPDDPGPDFGGVVAATDRCDAEGVPAYLESSDPANVPLYERHGFSVTGEVTIVDGPTIPLMWRDPQS